MHENTVFQLADVCDLVLQQPGGFKTSCEENYSFAKSNEWKKEDKMSELPVLIMGKNQKILLSEFDLISYPGLFLKGNAVKYSHETPPLLHRRSRHEKE